MRFAWLGMALLAPIAARATEDYPLVIEEEWETAGPPACWVCHTGDVRTRYTITTPFGQALRARGMTAEDDDGLRHALRALETEGVDSDLDGITDHDELVAGTDPNLPEGDERPPQIEYGCCGQIASGPLRGRSAAVLVAIALVAILGLREGRRDRFSRRG